MYISRLGVASSAADFLGRSVMTVTGKCCVRESPLLKWLRSLLTAFFVSAWSNDERWATEGLTDEIWLWDRARRRLGVSLR